MNKILICYFSASGVTRSVSEKLASFLNGDLFEIKPYEEYTAKDLDWENQESRSSKEMADHSSRPKIKEKLTDIEKYETILIGYPIWWDLAPRIKIPLWKLQTSKIKKYICLQLQVEAQLTKV